jgi:hypothetical protein
MKKYHIWFDYKGYMINPGSFSEGEAPLFGSKFSTGEPAYSGLDFWQRSGSTDFHRGHNQKYHVDPAMFQESYGCEVQDQPGQITLVKSPTAVTVPAGSTTEFTAELVTLNYTYLGTVDGKIYKITHSTGVVTLAKDTGEGSEITGFFEFTNPDDSTKVDIYACIPATGKFTWRWDDNAGSWGVTDITGLRSAAVWGTDVYGAFGLTVKYSSDPRTLAGFANTAFALPAGDVAINSLTFGRERLWIGTYSRLLGYDGGGAPWELYDFSWARHAKNFKSMNMGDNYLWFNIYNQGIFYTNGASIGMTTIHKDSEFLDFKYAIAVGSQGPIIWAIFQDGDDNFWLAKSKYRNYWFKYIELDGFVDTKLGRVFGQGTNTYIASPTGILKVLNSSSAYATTGRLISSSFDANLILLDKLVKSLTTYHKPLATGETVTLRANFDDRYTVAQFSSWPGASHTYAAGDSAPGFEATFKGSQVSGRKIYDPGLFSQRFQYGVVLEGNGNSTPTVEDLFWTYYLERPYGEDAREKEWSFAIIARDELEKTDEEVIDLYEMKAKTGEMIKDDLWDSRKTKGVKNFVGPNHELTQAFKLAYTGAGTYSNITIDQVNSRLAIESDVVGDEHDIDLTAAGYDSLGSLISSLNALDNYTCTAEDEANLSTSSLLLLPVKTIDVKSDAGAEGLLFYTATDQHKVIVTSLRSRDIRQKSTAGEEQAIIYISLREKD